MRCECCGEDAESALETVAAGLSFLCGDCADSCFVARLSERYVTDGNSYAEVSA